MLAVSVARVIAATGTVLVQYEAARGTLPLDQGWSYDSHCLVSNCPANPVPPYPGYASQCHFQGEIGNDCTLGHGCGPRVTPAFAREHYNAPSDPLGVTEPCSYTEWIAFDDGQDFVDQPYPVALPNRNLTFGPGGLNSHATTWGAHVHPAFGAPGFLNAPLGHHAIRIVTGSGVPLDSVLPAQAGNNRNRGLIDIRRGYTVPSGATALTLVAKLACGNRDHNMSLMRWVVRWPGGSTYQFALGVDGVDGSLTLGRFTQGADDSAIKDMFGTRTVLVALARKDIPGPHTGEFFTVRLVLRNNGSMSAWLNEDPASLWTGNAYSGVGASFVKINPDEQSGTMWLDRIRLMEGEVAPSACGDPVFDVNDDWRVDASDLGNGQNGLLDCMTGPAPAAGVFDALSARCKCHDVNHDSAIDMNDFAAFQRCIATGDFAADPACDN